MLTPGCVTYPILVQQGYMAVQHGYMAVQQGYMEGQQGYMAVQQGYMLDKLSTNEKPWYIVPESSRPIAILDSFGWWGGLGLIIMSNLNLS